MPLGGCYFVLLPQKIQGPSLLEDSTFKALEEKIRLLSDHKLTSTLILDFLESKAMSHISVLINCSVCASPCNSIDCTEIPEFYGNKQRFPLGLWYGGVETPRARGLE